MNLRDTWARGNVHELPEEARTQLRMLSPLTIWKTQKFALDQGNHIPIEELAEVAGIPIEEVLRYARRG